MVVQTPATVQIFSAGMLGQFGGFVATFVDGFQAISREAGRRDEYALDAAPSQLLQRFVGIRLQPQILAKQRLERLRPAPGRPLETLQEQLRRAPDLFWIGIAA